MKRNSLLLGLGTAALLLTTPVISACQTTQGASNTSPSDGKCGGDAKCGAKMEGHCGGEHKGCDDGKCGGEKKPCKGCKEGKCGGAKKK
jgi:hypothetical protein